ncbi:MAG TPA: Ig-like domain-containing protein [Phenylobacterium sp.]|nr:Ig-like domain-containing protein [Phenylobacterium sp.]
MHVALLALLAAAPALAAPVVAPPSPPTTVSGVTIYATPPKVTATWPAAGQTVASGVIVLSVRFNEPMLASRFDIAPAPGSPALNCLKTPRLLNDGQTFVLLCTAAPKTTYALAFNAQPVADGQADAGFANIGERRAESATLSFTTNDADGARNVAQAMKAAGLGELDSPIQDSPPTRPRSPAGQPQPKER